MAALLHLLLVATSVGGDVRLGWSVQVAGEIATVSEIACGGLLQLRVCLQVSSWLERCHVVRACGAAANRLQALTVPARSVAIAGTARATARTG